MALPADESGVLGPEPDRSLPAGQRGDRPRPPGYGLVLLAIVLAILIVSVGKGGALGRLVALLVLASALLLALRTAQVPRRLQRRAAILVGLAVLVGVGSILANRALVPGGLDTLITSLLVAGTAVVLARRLVWNPEVTGQTLLGAVCVYLLIGLLFAFLFPLSAAATGSSFFASAPNPTTTDYLYFSYVTLETVGYGDLVAEGDLGRMLAVTEGLSGQLYLVTVVALLVSNIRRPARDGQE
jgi:hypothetical protein